MEIEQVKIYPLNPIAYMDGSVCARTTRPCTQHKNSASLGSSTKKYRWSSGTKRVVRSKCAALGYEAKKLGHSVWFITLTSSSFIETNKVVSNFTDNMKKRGYLSKFVWVRERQERGANHWHIVFSSTLRRLDYMVFQSAWNSALRNGGYDSSKNSVRFGKQPRVYNLNAVTAYISKYLTKGKKPVNCTDVAILGSEHEWIRLTHSSRIQYKGVVPLHICNTQVLINQVYLKTDYFVYYKFQSDATYQSWCVSGWQMNEYLNSLYTLN
jgi:hypothetical protein